MKGFLQRLALGVMRPVGTIHPMVGSVFSTQHHAGPREVSPPGETAFISTQRKSDSKHSLEERESGSHASEEKSGVASQALEPNRLRAPDPIYTPLVSTAEALQSKGRQPENLSRATEERISSPYLGDKPIVEILPRPEEHTAGGAQELVVKHVYAPRMSDSTVGSSSLKAPAQQTAPFPAARRSTQQENSQRRSGTPSRQPDEIQIHIGRIEVTAVQQTPVPPVVKPARKGLSLDEYLQRANRRGR